MNLRSMQPLHNYEACKKYFEECEKPNGSVWGDHQRPLDGKRKYHVRIDKHDGISGRDDPRYALVLYQTSVTTYYSNGQVKVYHDQRQATRDFMWGTLPTGIAPHGRWHVQVETPEGTRWYMLGQATMFEPAGPGKWEIMGTPLQRKRTLIDKPVAAQVRRKLKPFFEWASMTNKIVPPSTGEMLNPKFMSDQEALQFLEATGPCFLWDRLRGRAESNRQDFLDRAYKAVDCYSEVLVDNSEPPGKQWKS